MTKPKLTLRQRYDEYWARCTAPFLEYTAPCCGGPIKTRRPNAGESWDSTVECVHCNSLFWMEATVDSVNASIPPARREA